MLKFQINVSAKDKQSVFRFCREIEASGIAKDVKLFERGGGRYIITGIEVEYSTEDLENLSPALTSFLKDTDYLTKEFCCYLGHVYWRDGGDEEYGE